MLRPSAEQMQRFSLRETDPEQAGSFEPIARGPVVAILALIGVGIVALVAMPIRLLIVSIRRR